MESTLKLRSLLRVLCILLLVPSYVYSQSPGGVRGQQFWYDDKDSTALISNYHSIDLLKMGQEARDSRARWKTPEGEILEWDYQHGEVEVYDKKGKHKGSKKPDGTGGKPAVPGRKTRN